MDGVWAAASLFWKRRPSAGTRLPERGEVLGAVDVEPRADEIQGHGLDASGAGGREVVREGGLAEAQRDGVGRRETGGVRAEAAP